MADRYDERYSDDPYTTGRGFAPHDRGFLERAGNGVRSWFGRDESRRESGRGPIEDAYESRPGWRARPGRDRSWAPERWERTTRWSGEQPADSGAAGGASRPWHERDDRYFAPADYEQWTRQGLGGRSTESRGVYEDDRGRVYQFEHGAGSFAGKGPKGYRRSDDRIREDICDRLTDDWRIDPTDVEVAVSDGEVTLTGVVNSRGEKRRAEDLVEDVHGVRDVHNNLRVNTSR
jgi:hypothetical protein